MQTCRFADANIKGNIVINFWWLQEKKISVERCKRRGKKKRRLLKKEEKYDWLDLIVFQFSILWGASVSGFGLSGLLVDFGLDVGFGDGLCDLRLLFLLELVVLVVVVAREPEGLDRDDDDGVDDFLGEGVGFVVVVVRAFLWLFLDFFGEEVVGEPEDDEGRFVDDIGLAEPTAEDGVPDFFDNWADCLGFLVVVVVAMVDFFTVLGVVEVETKLELGASSLNRNRKI